MGAEAVMLKAFAGASIDDILRALRVHLAMDIAFVGRFIGDSRVVRYVSLADGSTNILGGTSHTLVDTYCHLLAEGSIPPVIHDTDEVPVLADLRITEVLRIKSYIGVPVELSSGELYGTLCCLGHGPNGALLQRHLDVLEFAARYVAQRIEDAGDREPVDATLHDQVSGLLGCAGEPRMLYQPVVRLEDGAVVGYEALARFPAPNRDPVRWFVNAHAVDLGVALEQRAAEMALAAFPSLPAEAYLALNLGARALVSIDIAELLAEVDPQRIVVELTEHDSADERALLEARDRLADVGARLALDDVGAGHAGLTRLVDLRPDVVKLDRALVRRVHDDPLRQALVVATVGFNAHVGSTLVAEGVELEAEAAMLRELGVVYGQGFHLGLPAPPPA